MLVLSRKPGEGVAIGDDVRVHVGQWRNGTIRLAFDAPSHISLRRLELSREAVEVVPLVWEPIEVGGSAYFTAGPYTVYRDPVELHWRAFVGSLLLTEGGLSVCIATCELTEAAHGQDQKTKGG